MQHLTGTHFSAVLHGDVTIELGENTKKLNIHTDAGTLFVDRGMLDHQTVETSCSRPVSERESLQLSIDSLIHQADCDMEIALHSGEDREGLILAMSAISRKLASAVAKMQRRA